MPKGSRLLVIASGLSLVAIASVGLGLPFSIGSPRIYSPYPALTIWSAFILSKWGLANTAVLIPVVLFFAWLPSLLTRESPSLPKRTFWLISILSALTILNFSLGWKYGVEYQGLKHTMIVMIINVIWLGVLWCVALRAWRQPSFKATLLTHWLLFSWLSWYALPYLGELP